MDSDAISRSSSTEINKKSAQIEGLGGNNEIPNINQTSEMEPATFGNPNSHKNIGVKLFVGQVPKVWEEDDIKHMFRMFGDIEDISIIRDQSGNHRGCAFVKFAS